MAAGKIGAVWQQGEELVRDGEHLEGLLMFHRAKALLISESSNLAGENNQRVSKILGDIMTKLNASIDKNVVYLTRNPQAALKLHRGCNKKDVKKAYRANALKYHPDKNQDCDSSPVFTIVQSAYENLLLAAPDAPRTPTSRAGRRSDMSDPPKPPQPQPQPTQRSAAQQKEPSYGGLYSSERESEDPTSKAYRLAGREKGGQKRTTHASSNVAHLTTDELRSVLNKFGFARTESMGRDELVKKYLAVNAHMKDSKYNASAADYGKKTSAKVSAKNVKVDSKLTDEWREAIRREREREQAKRQQSMGVGVSSTASCRNARHSSFSSAQQDSFSGIFSDNHFETDETRTRYHEKSFDELEEENRRADAADLQRKRRASSLREQISTMKVFELRHLMEASGILLDGCFERQDLVERLCAFYGIPVPSSSASSESTPRPQQQEQEQEQEQQKQHPQPPQTYPRQPPKPVLLRVSADMDVERLRQAMRAGGVQAKDSDLSPAIAKYVATVKSAVNTESSTSSKDLTDKKSTCRYHRKTMDSTTSIPSPEETSHSVSTHSKYVFSGMTKSRLQNLEEKILGNRARQRLSSMQTELQNTFAGLKIASGFCFDENDDSASEGERDDEDPISARHYESEFVDTSYGLDKTGLRNEKEKIKGETDKDVYSFGRSIISDDESDGAFSSDSGERIIKTDGSSRTKAGADKNKKTQNFEGVMWRSEDDDIFEQFNRRFLEKRFLFVDPDS